MKVYMNRSQVARHLGVSPETLRNRISVGMLSPDAVDGLKADLFSAKAIEEYQKRWRNDLKSGRKLPAKPRNKGAK